MSPFSLSPLLLAVALASAPIAALAQTASDATPEQVSAAASELVFLDAAEVDLDSYLWTKRVLVVFADTPADPRFVQQMQLLAERPRDMVERDVIVVTDTDPAARTEVRKRLRPRGFALVMIDKDGVVKLRKPSPWHTREIGRSIDKTPLRRQEIRERGVSGSAGG